ncbi:uncharacterized protein OCT59_003525 [Rhizophagus irregularis]|uniref:RNI-like protein n=2 Tax=Rhizophagus irregularis TaxID=588596 RepID=U9TII4_RHIID|nr:hypothetical protein GLOIN_2v1886032 [Rhizophagus irregularis DAOM 181602=DAOM 197198]EXX70302.1 hypothetical protein RirG_088720 [Rhizophagus irregularis DAOM 197198w]POG58187.1 hypothetical protein GLOIN_2v1886032 [Rhizophagus irregularis DAOM 181602=DAOM 197198]UZO11973.1 hypothetical protein OCT59_003525 [Rhizophagus irregularis]|eukprot:XP_025165053.1 hypothetical protein GLOIN_2v1886032 [Rhizophagus irregularis DAOM 181602=DAOM 197198]
MTLIFCFNKEEILQLKNKLEQNQINNINLDEEYKPLFEYPEYLEDYNYITIDHVLYKYCLGLLIPHKKLYDIKPIFHQSILRQSKNIKKLDISTFLFYRESFKNFNVQNFTSNLTRLNSLSLNLNDTSNNIEQEFLSNMATINLQELIINFSSHVIVMATFEKPCKIIQEQNKLKKFKILNCYSLLNNILLSLEFQKNSLVQLEFINSNFDNASLKSFNNLYNLKYLSFTTCKGILLDQCEILKFVPFKLKELSFLRNSWDANVTPLMIKYLGSSLQRLLIKNPTILSIEHISMYCSNLISLKIRIDIQFNSSVLPFFRNLRTKILNLSIIKYDTELFINLSNNIPINISKISINYYSANKYFRFKEFLENCHNKFEIINLNYIVNSNFLKIILNYIERSNNSSLKILGLKDLDGRLNDEKSMLLNSIKAKGIKLMEFHNLNNDCGGISGGI